MTDYASLHDDPGHIVYYRPQIVLQRRTLTQRRARWLVRSIPDREHQHVYYERRRIGYQVTVEDRHVFDAA